MKIAVLSDSHDRFDHLQKVLDKVRELEITHVFHLGDFVAPITVLQMLEYAPELSWQCVWGNCDGDKALTILKTKDNHRFDIGSNDFRGIEIDGKNVFLTHYPEIAEIAVLSEQYSAVFFGHTHDAIQEMRGETLLANPGEVSAMKTGKVSFGVYDTETNGFEIIFVP